MLPAGSRLTGEKGRFALLVRADSITELPERRRLFGHPVCTAGRVSLSGRFGFHGQGRSPGLTRKSWGFRVVSLCDSLTALRREPIPLILTADVGNTNIVLGGFEGDELFFVSRIKTDRDKMADEYAITLKSLLEINGYQNMSFTGAIISSVVPPLLPALKAAIEKLLGCRVMTVSPGTRTGLNIRIDNPAETGADLVCGCVGALARYSMPCVVVDLGTATKFLVLDENGNFLGGPIMPGAGISLDALSRQASLLPRIEFSHVDHIIGTNSIDSMQAGILYGTAAMIDGVIARIREELGGKPLCAVMTGGLAKSVFPYCRGEYIYDENLLLWGLLDIYKRNNRSRK